MPITAKAKTTTPKAEKASPPEKKTTAPKAAAPKKEKAPKAKPAPKPRAPGKSEQVYAMALKHPTKNGKEIAELLIADGLQSTAETIGTIRSDFIRAVNFCASQGLLKSPFIKGDGQ
jgi:hypothetical protein